MFLTSADMAVQGGQSEYRSVGGWAEWISSGAGPAVRSTTYRICAEMGFVPNITLRTEYYDLVTEFVAAGLGVAIVPALGIMSHDRVNILPVQSKWAARTVSLVYRDGVANPLIPLATESFAQTVRAAHWGPHITMPDQRDEREVPEHPSR